MSTQHTPGPWKFTEGEFFYVNARVDGRRFFILQRKKTFLAASTDYKDAEEDRIRADCALIAAAPELLEALIALQVQANSTELARAHDMARAAIAKATGQ
jgi:hypothetical protein